MQVEKVRTIRLYGTLGAKFGRVHRLAVNSTAEAVKALCIMVPGFERFLLESKDKGLEFSVFIGRENISQEQLHYPVGSDDIRIAPVISGSKRGGLLQTIVGVVLVVVGMVVPGAQFLVSVGLSLAFGGIAQMLAPQPEGLGADERPENRPSYSFNGAVNTKAQGGPVPLLYGEMIVGSAVISAGIYAEDQQ